MKRKSSSKKIRILEEEEAILWEKTSKYRKLLDESETIPIQESEEDRKEVSQLKVEKPRGKFLEAHTYHLLAQMAKSRDTHILVQDMDPRTRLNMIGWFVRTRTTPLLCLPGLSVLTIQLMTLQTIRQRPTEVQIFDGQTEFTEPPSQPEPITMKNYPADELEKIKERLKMRLNHQVFDLKTLEASLTSLEGDLLSEMASEREIEIKYTINKRETLIEFIIPEEAEQDKDYTVLVFEPTLNQEK
ncbi:MAG: hypothetical protein ACFFC7_02345 [Candidatus Hermodarchaeota archaeon]